MMSTQKIRRASLFRSAVLVFALIAACQFEAARAERSVRLYEVTVAASDQNAAFQEAMRTALVRATGKRDAADDRALADLVSQARRYVQAFKPAAAGGMQVVLDGAAIERAIVAAGRTTWPRERPLTLVLLQSAPGVATGDTATKALVELAQFRGLPVAVGAAANLQLPAGDVTREQALAAAQRAGADAILIGDGTSAAVGGPWRWSLYSSVASESWSGSLDDGIHGATDALARASEVLLALPEAEARVAITGVTSLRDFATVSSALAQIAGVRRVAVIEASAGGVMFNVAARGGIDTILGHLASDARFERVDGAAGGAIGFRYRP